MTVILELPLEVETQVQAEAAKQSLPITDYLVRLIMEATQPRALDARALRALPRAERNRVLAMQAEAAAPLYEADLARPVEERELTAFTALDGEPIYDHTP